MSKTIDYKKELRDSILDAAYLTGGLYAVSWGLSKLGIQKPPFSITAENIGKIVIYLAGADMLKDYLKQQKIIPGM